MFVSKSVYLFHLDFIRFKTKETKEIVILLFYTEKNQTNKHWPTAWHRAFKSLQRPFKATLLVKGDLLST